MFKLKTLSLVTLVLLLQSCANSSRKYDIVGIWDSECIDIDKGANYTNKSVYTADGLFKTQMSIKFFFTSSSSFSGTYRASKSKLVETVNNIHGQTNSNQLPATQISNLKWIDDNSILITTGNQECTSTRVSGNY